MDSQDKPSSLHEKHREGLAARQLSARIVLAELRQHMPFASVLDVGCGVGAWLAAAQELGATRVYGVDGPRVKPHLLDVNAQLFRTIDLNQEFDLQERFSLVVCIEVGEHIKPRSSDGFVSSIARHGDAVLFSAAIPGQGGPGHINESWPELWVRRFEASGFDAYDPLRHAVWGDERVAPWVQQNVLLFLRRGIEVPSLAPFRVRGVPHTLIHRTTYNRLRRQIGQLNEQIALLQQTVTQVPSPVLLPSPAPYPAVSTVPAEPASGQAAFADALTRAQAKAPQVTAIIERCLTDDLPLSLIRLSHCESKFLNWPDIFTRKEINRSLLRQFGYTTLTEADLLAISAMLKAAVASSDIIGMPVLNKNNRERLEQGDDGMRLWDLVAPACARHKLLRSEAIMTSQNIHLRLQESDFLARMVRIAPRLTLVGCRDLRTQFIALGFNDVQHIPVPEAARTRGADAVVPRHYPEAFHAILTRIRTERRNGLFLVGAGFLGKIYCSEIRLAGGVAVDVGSVMDVWAGVPSRTGHEGLVARYAL